MTLVMGILNVTPDSFSDGGRWSDPEAAIQHARELVALGAAIIDVGGESTRPGADRVTEPEELQRVVPVVAALADEGIRVSVDTMRASVAQASVEAGAEIINDVSGGKADPAMLPFIAESSAHIVLMHWRAHSSRMHENTAYGDVVADVMDELTGQRDQALSLGIPAERIILDPGIGFSKTAEHNWLLLRHLDRFQGLGHRVLLGVSRKGFLGSLLGGKPAPERDAATAAVTAWAAIHGVWAVRTHEISMQLDAAAVGSRLADFQPPPAAGRAGPLG